VRSFEENSRSYLTRRTGQAGRDPLFRSRATNAVQTPSDRFIVGDGHAVRDELQRYVEILGVDHLLLRVEWPGLEHREALENIERITDVVGGL